MLSARNLKLSFGARTILDDASLALLPKDRIALVGENGVGKSSLLAILAGEPADSGLVELAKDTRVGILRQVPELMSGDSVVTAVRSAMEHHLLDIANHENLCTDLANPLDENARARLAGRIDRLARKIESNGGFDVDYWVERVLTRLGISAREQEIGTLSGGERRRVDLARVLLMAPDVYLLDEPTNHLDIEAIQFLVEVFSSTSSAV